MDPSALLEISTVAELAAWPVVLISCGLLAWRRPGALTESLDRALAPALRFARRPVAPLVLVAAAVFASCAGYAALRGAPRPIVSDEFSYLLAADTFAHGRLTNEALPRWQHFEAVGVLQQPTYQSKYPPGQGLILALGRLAGDPALGVWLGVAAMAAAITFMMRVWVSPGWALAGGLVVVARFGFGSTWAQSYWGGALAAAGAAVAYGSVRLVLTVDGGRRLWAAVALGAGLGVLAITRPYEGLIASLPLAGILILWTFTGQPTAAGRPGGATATRCALGILAGLLPILAFLGLYQYRVTGDALIPPHLVYESRYSIMPEFVPLAPRDGEPQGPKEMRSLARSATERYRPGALTVPWDEAWSRFTDLVSGALGVGLLAILAVGLRSGLRDPWIRFAWLHLACALSAHLFVYWHFRHYAAPSVPILLLLAVTSLRAVAPARRNGRAIGRLVVTSVLALQALVAVHGSWVPPRSAEWADERRALESRLESDDQRHLLFVRYGHYHLAIWEWVYNGADPAHQDVIWARDLGDERNRELMAAFPDREYWLVLVDATYRGVEPETDRSQSATVDSERPPIAELRAYSPE